MMILRRRMMGGNTGGEPSIDYASMYFTIEALTAGTIGFTGEDLYYSLDDGSTWSALVKKTPINLQANDKILFKGTPTPLEDGDEYLGVGSFYGTCSFNVYGNAMSLLFGDNFESQCSLAGKNRAIDSLFSDYIETESPASVVDASNLILPATTLSEYCYDCMFYRCNSLVSAPELPATTLVSGCYYSMFYGCTSLTTAPELPAPVLVNDCYGGMFDYCSSLNYVKALFTTTPSSSYTKTWLRGVSSTGTFVKSVDATWTTTGTYAVPTSWVSTNQNSYEYNKSHYLTLVMLRDSSFSFSNTGLSYSDDNGRTWKVLPANTSISLLNGQKVLLKGTITPSSSAGIGTFSSNGYCYVEGNAMSLLFGDNFVNQTNLEGKDYAFYQLFYAPLGGSTIKYAINLVLPATTLSSNCYESLFRGQAGLLEVNTKLLPALTLTTKCYNEMFSSCSNIKTVPELPATTLVSKCYERMFRYCYALHYIKAMFLTEPGTDYTSNWVGSMQSSGTFVKNAAATWNVTGNNGVPTGWTVQTASE